MTTDPLLLLACTALYLTVDPSRNTCTYRWFQSATSVVLKPTSPLPVLLFSSSLLIGHWIRPNSHRRCRSPLGCVERSTSLARSILRPPRSWRGLGRRTRPQSSYQQTRYIWSSFRAYRSPTLLMLIQKRRSTRLGTILFSIWAKRYGPSSCLLHF